jgi:hypothetical protein
MIWITPRGHFLIQGEMYPIYLSLSGQGITLPTGEVIHAAPRYVEVTCDGDIVHTYSGPITSTLDDYLYVSDIHVVLGSALHSFFWSETLDSERLKDSVVLDGLIPYTGNDAPTAPE